MDITAYLSRAPFDFHAHQHAFVIHKLTLSLIEHGPDEQHQ